TRNSQRDFNQSFDFDFVYLASDAAQYLVDCGVQLVGIDALGIERNQKDHATHRILLGGGVMVIEGLRLGHVTPGGYQLGCAPLLIQQAEAAPCRAWLTQL
ncbi:MAG: cyclase family protein, partial [Candidatus Dependentiae bacterium]